MYANVVIKMMKLYMNYDIILEVIGITLSIIGKFLNTAQKHNSKILSIIGNLAGVLKVYNSLD